MGLLMRRTRDFIDNLYPDRTNIDYDGFDDSALTGMFLQRVKNGTVNYIYPSMCSWYGGMESAVPLYLNPCDIFVKQNLADIIQEWQGCYSNFLKTIRNPDLPCILGDRMLFDSDCNLLILFAINLSKYGTDGKGNERVMNQNLGLSLMISPEVFANPVYKNTLRRWVVHYLIPEFAIRREFSTPEALHNNVVVRSLKEFVRKVTVPPVNEDITYVVSDIVSHYPTPLPAIG